MIDGRDLGLARQLARRTDGEAEPPATTSAEPEAAEAAEAAEAEARAARAAARRAAEAARGEDWSVRALLREAKGGGELAALLEAAGYGGLGLQPL